MALAVLALLAVIALMLRHAAACKCCPHSRSGRHEGVQLTRCCLLCGRPAAANLRKCSMVDKSPFKHSPYILTSSLATCIAQLYHISAPDDIVHNTRKNFLFGYAHDKRSGSPR
jgi:hypothetical protein